MSIKQRIRALELQYKMAMSNVEALIIEFDSAPSEAQQQQIDEATKQGRPYFCLIAKGDTLYYSRAGGIPPWLN